MRDALWYSRLRPTVQAFPLLSMGAAMLAGVVLWGGFNWSLELSNTEEFCISCHVMKNNVYAEYKKTIHYNNRTGVRATCPDCHVPKEWTHKVVRKIQATNEVFHWLAGTVDTREKFIKRRPQLAEHVWQVMGDTDSRECRNCHSIASMDADTQEDRAGTMHQLAVNWKMTCINCHKGIAHSLPDDYDPNILMDKLHERFEEEKIACYRCHKEMARPPEGEKWGF